MKCGWRCTVCGMTKDFDAPDDAFKARDNHICGRKTDSISELPKTLEESRPERSADILARIIPRLLITYKNNCYECDDSYDGEELAKQSMKEMLAVIEQDIDELDYHSDGDWKGQLKEKLARYKEALE